LTTLFLIDAKNTDKAHVEEVAHVEQDELSSEDDDEEEGAPVVRLAAVVADQL
jgi:hypothetical protein